MIEMGFRTLATPSLIRVLVKSVVAVLEEFLDKDLLYDLRLVLTEACNNIYEHAYRGKEGVLELKMLFSPGRYVQFELLDWGMKAENFLCLTEERLFLLEEPASSGRGVYIMKQLLDNLCFKRKDGANLLIMRKNLGEGKWKVCK
jgi:anti-sigma regulatory factor (Ser/Thr protein kinase)